MCDEALSWRNNTHFDSFPCRLVTSVVLLCTREMCGSLLWFLHPSWISQPAISHLCPKKQSHRLWDWLLCWNFFGWGEPLCLHYLDHSFVSGSYKYIQVSFIVTCKAKKPAVFCLKSTNFPVKPQHNHASDPHSNILALMWQRASTRPTRQEDEPYIFLRYLQGLCYLLGWNSPTF